MMTSHNSSVCCRDICLIYAAALCDFCFVAPCKHSYSSQGNGSNIRMRVAVCRRLYRNLATNRFDIKCILASNSVEMWCSTEQVCRRCEDQVEAALCLHLD